MTVLHLQLPPRRTYLFSPQGKQGPIGPAGSGDPDHGDLTGLADDDHTQYHNDTRGDVRYNTKSEITSLLSGKAASSHTHAQSDVTGLVSALAAKADDAATTSALAGKAAASHTHAQSEVTGLVAALAAKADGSTTTSALALKADLVSGVIPSSQIPAIAITEYLGTVATEGAMLALVGDQGDWCIRTDSATAWVLSADDSSLIGSWVQIPHPQSPVLSVNGQTGVITLGASDVSAQAASGSLTATITTSTPTALVGLLVGNGSDVDVLESTTNGHVLRVSGGAKGWGTLDAASIGAGAVSDTEFGYLNGVTSALQTQIDGKAATSHTHAQSDVTNLTTDLAAKRSKVDEGEFNLPTPTVSTIVLLSKAQLARTINGLYALQTTAGTVTFTVKINGTAVTGLTAITATTTPQDVTASGANSVAVNDPVTLEITAVSSGTGLRFTGKETLT